MRSSILMVPLLLVDFRDTTSPKRREMIRHAVTDAVSGVLGISKFGNWPYLTGSFAFNFVWTRHGATNNRSARLKAYAEVREQLALDTSIDSGLRADLQRRLEIMGVENPMCQRRAWWRKPRSRSRSSTPRWSAMRPIRMD